MAPSSRTSLALSGIALSPRWLIDGACWLALGDTHVSEMGEGQYLCPSPRTLERDRCTGRVLADRRAVYCGHSSAQGTRQSHGDTARWCASGCRTVPGLQAPVSGTAAKATTRRGGCRRRESKWIVGADCLTHRRAPRQRADRPLLGATTAVCSCRASLTSPSRLTRRSSGA